MSYEPKGPRLNKLLGLPDPLPPDAYIQLTNGKFILGTNEAGTADENGTDASGFSAIGPNAKWSFKTMDGFERVLMVMRPAANGTDGEVAWFLWVQARFEWAMAQGTETWRAKANDYAMMQVLLVNPAGGFEFDLAMAARGAQPAGQAMQPGDRITSGKGRFVEILQESDGNFVIYDTRLGAVGDANAAIWSTLTGHIRDAAPDA